MIMYTCTTRLETFPIVITLSVREEVCTNQVTIREIRVNIYLLYTTAVLETFSLPPDNHYSVQCLSARGKCNSLEPKVL